MRTAAQWESPAGELCIRSCKFLHFLFSFFSSGPGQMKSRVKTWWESAPLHLSYLCWWLTPLPSTQVCVQLLMHRFPGCGQFSRLLFRLSNPSTSLPSQAVWGSFSCYVYFQNEGTTSGWAWTLGPTSKWA